MKRYIYLIFGIVNGVLFGCGFAALIFRQNTWSLAVGILMIAGAVIFEAVTLIYAYCAYRKTWPS